MRFGFRHLDLFRHLEFVIRHWHLKLLVGVTIRPGSSVKTNDEKPKRERSWRDDYFASCEVLAQFWGWWIIPIMSLAGVILLPLIAHFKNSTRGFVVVYTSQDQVYAEPIL